MKTRFSNAAAFLLPLLILALAATAFGQRRDYLTDSEVELVRDAQEIDQRMNVLTMAIDRRLAALDLASVDRSKKYGEKWGDAPTGSRLELFTDVKSLLQKAIDDIDDASTHESENAENKVSGTLFPKAVRVLADAAERYRPALRSALDSSKDEKEKGTILASIDFCDQIVEASAKLPKAAKPDKKKRSKDNGN
ncbi:MAG TPA: hypothetical protein VL325_07665 [Pyrinomonadaceae bacterium]|nr:hypothetical protein [Pyrinomonadaceae bacterium]